MLRHVSSIHQPNPGASRARIGFVFTPRARGGEPVNAEPHKHSGLVWADPARLPPGAVGYVAAVITAVEHGLTFTLNGDRGENYRAAVRPQRLPGHACPCPACPRRGSGIGRVRIRHNHSGSSGAAPHASAEETA